MAIIRPISNETNFQKLNKVLIIREVGKFSYVKKIPIINNIFNNAAI